MGIPVSVSWSVHRVNMLGSLFLNVLRLLGLNPVFQYQKRYQGTLFSSAIVQFQNGFTRETMELSKKSRKLRFAREILNNIWT